MAALTAVLEAARGLALPATKPIVLLLFAAFGCAMVARAASTRRMSLSPDPVAPPRDEQDKTARAGTAPVEAFAGIALLLAALVVLARVIVTRSGVLFGDAAMAIVCIAMLARRTTPAVPRRAWVSAAAVVMLVLGLAWWDFLPSAPDASRLLSFGALFMLISWGLRSVSTATARMSTTPMIVTALALGALLTVDMGNYDSPNLGLELLAHHWGAYIGSAQDVLAGLRPYVDMPLQYGLGPTLTIAGACRLTGCWAGLHWLVVASTLAMAWLLLRMMLNGFADRSRIAQWMAAAVAFGAIFLWPGFAPFGSALVATPSPSGLRYLPVVIVAYLAFVNRPRWAAVAAVPAIWWAPEVAMMSMGVLGVAEVLRVGFLRASIRCGVLLSGAYATLAIGLRVAYGVWPRPDAFTEYLIHVPSPLPIDPTSAFLLLAATFGAAAWLLGDRSSNALTRRRDLIAIALLFVATTYYLGRSHPNSVCNLMPFIALVAFRALARTRTVALSTAITAGMAASVAALTLSGWNFVPLRHGFQPGMSAPIDAIKRLDPDLQAIRESIPNPQHLGIAAFTARLDLWPDDAVWTPLCPPSLWKSEPEDRRQMYVIRAARRLRQPGWVIASETEQTDWQTLLVAYRIETSWPAQGVLPQADGTFARYIVAKLVPR